MTNWKIYFGTPFLILIGMLISCQTPYSGRLGPEDFNGWVESEENGFVCLWNGFDRICVHREEVEVIVEKIIETVVIEEVIKEVPVEVVVERVVPEYIEVPIEVFIERTVEVIKEVVVEKEVIKEVPVEMIVEVVREVEVIREVPGEEVIKEVRVEVPGETVEVIKEVEVIREVPGEEVIKEVEVVKEVVIGGPHYGNPADYTNLPEDGMDDKHYHSFTHKHGGVGSHTHHFLHDDGEADDWEAIHENLPHE